jgi:HK97 family phage major capsid protein
MSDNLRNRLEVIQKDATAIQAASKAAGKDMLDADEAAQFDAKMAEFDAVEAQIKREEKAATVQAKLAAPQARPVIEVIEPVFKNTAKNGGFRHFADYLGAVRNAGFGRADPRLVTNAVTTYGNESVGADGGFLVPNDFRSAILSAWDAEENAISKFTPIITNSNVVSIPTSETTPHGTTGIQTYWVDEGGTITPTKPVVKLINITLWKVAGLVHLTDEMLSDAPAMQSFTAAEIGRSLSSKVSEALIAGDGNGKPQGLLNSPAKVTFTRTTASKVKAEDVTGMVARLRPAAYGKSFWLMHSSVYPQLQQMLLGTIPIWANNYVDSPYGTLLGRPIFVSEYCSTLGTSGDIVLCNPAGYVVAKKAAGVEMATTIAFAFDQGLNSLRAQVRIGGTPLLSAALGRKNGSDTLSDFVVLS